MILKIFLFVIGYIIGYLTLLIMLKYKEITEKQEKLEMENRLLKINLDNLKNEE